VQLFPPRLDTGQGHLVAHADKLSDAQKQHLAHSILSVGIAKVSKVHEKALRGQFPCAISIRGSRSRCVASLPSDSKVVKLDELMQPIPADLVASSLTAEPAAKEAWFRQGLELISRGKVGALLLAGGQVDLIF
jgi:hypothetical protein